jgi:uncharacterized repeat protein (TIGR01451 family)
MFLTDWRRWLNHLSRSAAAKSRRTSRRRQADRQSTRLRMEQLEDRTLLSTVPGVFNTGVDPNAALLPDGAVDPHYALLATSPGGAGPAFVVLQNGFPVGNPWIADGPNSKWIGTPADQSGSSALGTYDYQTTFNLTGFDPTSAVLTGQWAADDQGTNILLNGTPTATATGFPGYSAYHPISISGPFVSGVNTLDFIVPNTGGPAGLRVDNLQVTANPTALTVNGTAGNDTLTVNATSANSGTYSLDGGAPVPFSGITSFTFNGNGGTDLMVVNNPAGGLFAPSNGIFYNATPGTGSNLEDLGGSDIRGISTPTSPNAGTIQHIGNTVTQTITYSGLDPVVDTVPEANYTVNGTAGFDNINVTDGPIVGGVQTDTVNSVNATFVSVSFGNKTNVTVNGQGGADSITLDSPTAATGLATFTIDPAGAGATVNVNRNSVPTTVTDSAGLTTPTDTVVVGSTGSVQGIAASVSVSNPSGLTDLTVNDSADGAGQTASISATDVTGLAPATISYTTADLHSLTVDGGTGGNTFTVTNTPANVFTAVTTTLNAGAGADAVTVQATSGFNGATLNIDGTAGSDTVTLGNAGSVQGIAGTVNVENHFGFNRLVLDDSADATARVVTIATLGTNPADSQANTDAYGSVTGLAPAAVNYEYADTDPLVLDTGTAGNTVNLRATGSTAPFFASTPTTITAAGDDTVNVGDTSNTLNEIFSPVTVTAPAGLGTVNLNDQGDAAAHTYALGAVAGTGTFSRDASPDITTTVAHLNVNGSSGGNTYNIANTATGTTTTVTAGTGADTATIGGTGGTLNYNGQNGLDVVTLGTAGSAQGILGTVNLENPGSFNDITVNDSADATARTVTLDTLPAQPPSDTAQDGDPYGTITGLAPAAINYEYADTTHLTLDGGTGGNTFNVHATGTPTTINDGAGNDTVVVGNTANLLTGINSALTVNGQGGSDVLQVNDQADSSATTWTINSTSITLPSGVVISYDPVMSVILNGGLNNDFFNVTPSPIATYTINGGPEGVTPPGDTLNLSLGACTGAVLTITSSAGGHLNGFYTFANCAPVFFTSIETLSPAVLFDLNIVKTGPATTTPGVPGGLVYTITVSNVGSVGEVGATVTDMFPTGPNAIVSDSWTCSVTTPGSPPITSCTPGPVAGNINDTVTLAAGSTITYTVTATVNSMATGTLTNTATVTPPTGVPENTPADNTSSFTTILVPAADLAVVKTGDATATAGANVTYTLTVTNNGPSDSMGVSLNDAGPNNATFVSEVHMNTVPPPAPAVPATFTCSTPAVGQSGNLKCTTPNLPAGEEDTFVLVYHVNANTPSGTTLSNVATVGSALTFDPDQFNNSDTATTAITTEADLGVTKTVSALTVTAGQKVTYTITASNAGPSDAQGVVLTDTLPPDVATPVVTPPAGWSCGIAGSTITCSPTGGTFAANNNGTPDTVLFTVVGTVPQGTANGSLEPNVVSITSTTTDNNPANNSATIDFAVAASADLSVTKTTASPFITAGTDLTYTLSASNAGPSQATGVTLSDTVPAHTTFISIAQTSGPNFACSSPAVGGNGTVNCSPTAVGGTLLSGASATFTFVVHVNSNTPNVTSISNTADIASATADQNPTNNSSTVTLTAFTLADLSITKTESPSPATPGTNVTYTLSVSNAGPSDAATTTVSDTLPAGLTFTSATPAGPDNFSCSNAGGTVTCTTATVPTGNSDTIVIVAHLSPAAADGSTLTNTATVSSTTVDPDTTDNSASTSTPVFAQTDVSITKTGPATVTSGTNITYTISVSNAGPSNANAVTVSDTIPTGEKFVSESSGICTVLANPGPTTTLTCDFGTLAPGATTSFTITALVNSNVANGTAITNTATVSTTTTDLNPANNTAATTAIALATTDVAISKTGPLNLTAGSNVTYTLSVTNNGPSDALNVSVVDALPAPDVTFVSVSAPASFTCTNPGLGNTGVVTCTTGVMVAKEADVITLVAHVPSSEANGTVLTNAATISTSTADSNTANNSASTSLTVMAVTDVSVAKTGPTTVTAGAPATYTITVSNAGPSDALNVALNDALPPSSTFVSETQNSGPTFACTTPAPGSGGTVHCTITSLTAGSASTFTLVLTPSPSAASGSTFTNTATVSTTSTDSNGLNNTATSPAATVTTSADLSINDPPTDVTAGQNVTFSITVSNHGPSDAQNVVVTDILPTGENFTSVTQSGSAPIFTCTTPAVGSSGSVVCSAPTMPAGTTAVFDVVAMIASSAPDGSTQTNVGFVTSTTPDPNGGNNVESTTVTVHASADLALTKTGPTTTTAGGPDLTYTLSLTNAGPSDAASVTVTDFLPAGETFVSATQATGTAIFGCTSPAAGVVTCSAGSVPVHDSDTFLVVVSVAATVADGTMLTDTAVASSSTFDPTAGDNVASVTTAVSAVADVGVTKTGLPSLTAGQHATYTISVTNNGPSDALNVTLTDNLPAGETFVSLTFGPGAPSTACGVGATISCTTPTLPAHASLTIFVTVAVGGTVTNGTVLTNTVFEASSTTDNNPANNSSSVTSTVVAVDDLSVVKTGPSTVTAGAPATYTITVSNAGPSDGVNVVVTDTLPSDTTATSATGPGFTCGLPAVGNVFTCTAPSLAAGSTALITVVVTPDSTVANGATLTNTAAVSSSTPDSNAANNSSSTSASVLTLADLAITKSGPATVTPGTNATYTLSVTNNGPSDALNVTISDVLSDHTTFVNEMEAGGTGFGCTNPGPGNTGTVACTQGLMPAGATATLTIVVAVPANVPDGAKLTDVGAVVSDPTPDPNTANNVVSSTSVAVAEADVGVTKTGPTSITAGQNATYTISVSNAGPSDSQGVTVTDFLPAGTTLVSSTQATGAAPFSCTSPAAGVVSCDAATLAAKDSATIIVVAAVPASTPDGTTLTNTVIASSTTSDTNPANNAFSINTAVQAVADVGVTKEGPDSATAGQNATYTIAVTNNGPSDAQNVTVTDNLPAALTFVSVSETPGGTAFICTAPVVGSTGTISCTAGTLPVGGSATFTVVTHVSSAVANGATFDNPAVVSSSTTDNNTANNSATETTTAVAQADLSVVKTGPASATAGSMLTYSITVSDAGPSDATSVTVTDTLPAGTTFVSASGASCSGVTAGGTGTLTCSIPTLAANTTATITLVLTADMADVNGTVLTNTATVSSPTPDANQANNSSSVTTTILGVADVSVSKSVAMASATAGSTATYSITVSNGGPSAAQNVQLTDAIPAGTVFQSAGQTGGTPFLCTFPATGSTGGIVCTAPTLSAGGLATFDVVVAVAATSTTGTVVTNTAFVTSNTPDNNLANNTASANFLVVASADLSVTKTGPTDATAGNNITYNITLSNLGPSDAASVTLSDTVPANTTFVSETQTSGATFFSCTTPAAGGTGTITCQPNTAGHVLPALQSATFQVVVHLSGTAPDGSTITNTASFSSPSDTDLPLDDSSTVLTTVHASAAVSVVKTGPGTVTAGGTVTYSVTVSNAGPSAAATVTLTDTLPDSTTFVSGTSPAGFMPCTFPVAGSGGTITCTDASLPAGASGVLTFVVTLPATTANGSTLTNTATVTTTTSNTSATTTASTTATVIASADLAITKTASATGSVSGTVTAGTDITYTLSVTNNGPSASGAVTISDTLPNTLAFVSATGAGFTCTNIPGGVVTCTGPALAAGATASLVLVAAVPSSDPNFLDLTNLASVAGPAGQADSNTANNTATNITQVLAVSDVSVTKTGPATATAGGTATYTITVSNAGPSDAHDVTLTDNAPAGSTVASITQTTGQLTGVTFVCVPLAANAPQASCDLPTLPAGQLATFQLVLNVSPSLTAGSTFANAATVTTSTADSNTANNTATAAPIAAIATSADLAVTKTGPGTATAGTNVTYTVSVTNNGPSDAQGVTLTDATPNETTFVSFTPTTAAGLSCTFPGVGATGTVTCTATTLAAHASAVFTYVVNVDATVANNTPLVNTATITSATADPTLADNTSSVNTTAIAEADLAVTKTAPANVTAGSNLTYTLSVVNNGPTQALAVSLNDTLPANTTFVSESQLSGTALTCNNGTVAVTGTLTCTAPVLAPAASAVVQLVVKLASSAALNTTVVNTATVGSTTADPNLANNTSTAATTVLTAADLAVTKSGPASVTAGTNATYTVTVTNNGPSDAVGVTVTDSVPANSTFVSESQLTGPTFGCTVPAPGSGGTVSCNAATLASGATATFQVVVKANASAGNGSSISNTATVTSTTLDTNTFNNSTTVNTSVTAAADLAVTKTGPATVTAGTDITYTISVTNNGPSDAQSVTLTDSVPANTTFVSNTQTSGTGFLCSNPPAGGTGTITCTEATLALNASATFTVVLHVLSSAAGTTNMSSLSNVATVSSTTSDTNTANNSSTATTAVTASAALAITKTGPATYTAGTNATYTISVTNGGPSDAQTVVLTDTIPANTTFQSFVQNSGLPTFTCTKPAVGGTGTVMCTAATVANGASDLFTLVVFVLANTPSTATIQNTANISSTTANPNPGSTTSTTPGANPNVATAANLIVTKFGSPDAAVEGDAVTYTMTVSNAGPSDAQNVTLLDVLPNDGVGLTANQSVGTHSASFNQFTYRFGTVPAGGSVTAQLVAYYPEEGNRINAAFANSSTPDTNPQGSVATSSILLSEAPTVTSPTTIGIPEGTPFNGVVATFTHGANLEPATSFYATISWGDGSPATVGTIVQGAGGYLIQGSHTYADEPAPGVALPFPITVALQDEPGNTFTINSVAAIQQRPLSADVPGAPHADQNARWVAEAIDNLQGTPASGTQINRYLALLGSASRKTVARKIVQAIGLGRIHSALGIPGGASPGQKAALYYKALLGRSADASGLRSKAALIASGNEVAAVAALIASDEYFNRLLF